MNGLIQVIPYLLHIGIGPIVIDQGRSRYIVTENIRGFSITVEVIYDGLMYHDTLGDPYHLQQIYFGFCYAFFSINVYERFLGRCMRGT